MPMLITHEDLLKHQNTMKKPVSRGSEINWFEKIVQTLDYGITVQDLRGKIVFANEIAAKLCGYKNAKELLKREVGAIADRFEIFNEAGVRLSMEKLSGHLAVRKGVPIEQTVRFKIKNEVGEYWSHVKSSPVYNNDNKIEGVINLFRDITHEKQIEHVLEHYRAIVESTDDAIIGKNLDGIITSWNPGAEKLYGYSAKEMIGKSITITIPENKLDEYREIMDIIRLGEGVDYLETQRIKKDGRIMDVSLTISPLKDSSGKIVGTSKIARDISQRKELERRKDVFISMASHELKTPVTTLKAFNQLLLRFHQDDKQSRDYQFLSKMDKQIENLTELITDLLDLSKIQAGKLELNKRKFSLDELVKELVLNMEGTTKHRIIIEGRTKIDILGDRDRIAQIIINLLSNAIKYSPKANKVLVRLTRENNNIIVAVQDFGIGIDSKFQGKIFDRFFRVEGTNEKTYPGLGMGLYISSEIAKRHGGHIFLESKKNKGSTFSLQLPIM
jgi:PAS domain S-box-containing protein